MTKNNLTYILNSLGYSTNQWIQIPKISRIIFTSDVIFYFEDNKERIAEYYFDTTHELVFKRHVVRATGEVMNIAAINGIDEITHIETLNARSESMFNGKAVTWK